MKNKNIKFKPKLISMKCKTKMVTSEYFLKIKYLCIFLFKKKKTKILLN